MKTHSQNQHHTPDHNSYKKLLIMILLSFIAMYTLMYSMVDSFDNVFHNVNQVYMAALMTAPMMIIEMILMGSMYKNKTRNRSIIFISIAVGILCFWMIRKQTAVSDEQFLRSMIPHHAGAVLMVEETELNDPEIQELARNIISSQQKEIAFMKAKLKQLEGDNTIDK
jgi:uncharacterized protein (DUF305 family)